MNRLDFETMQRLQRELQENYKDKWARLCPEHGRSSLLWMIGEASETELWYDDSIVIIDLGGAKRSSR